MSHETISIRTDDGDCPVHVFGPDTTGQWPGVVMFMDGLGVRPALFEIGQRLSDGGYCVLLPDLYYRIEFLPVDGWNMFRDPVLRAEWTSRVLPTVSIANIIRDTPAFFAHLNSRGDVREGKIGTTGYCLGGRLSLAAAGRFSRGNCRGGLLPPAISRRMRRTARIALHRR